MAPRKRPAAEAAAFLVTLHKEDVDALKIPASVYKKHKAGLLKTKVQLSVPGKSEYSIDISEGAFTNGWKNFCKGNGIKEGDTLVFKSTGSSTLACEVYSANGCVKPAGDSSRKKAKSTSYELISSDEEGQNEDERNEEDRLEDAVATGISAALSFPDQEQHIVFTNCEIRLSIRKLNGIGTTTKATPAARRTPAKKTPAKNKEDAADPSSTPQLKRKVSPYRNTRFSPGASPSKEASPAETPVANKSGVKSRKSITERIPAKVASPSRRSLGETPPPKSRLSAHKIPAKASNPVSKTPSKKTKAKAKAVKLMEKTPGGESARKAEPQTPAEAAAFAKAEAFTCSNPHLVVAMRKSSLAPSFCLGIPVAVARGVLPQELTEFKMLDAEDKSWNVRWLGYPKLRFSGGWCFFAQDHNLAKGDAIVLEMMAENKIKVHIFRASESNSRAADVPALATANGDETKGKIVGATMMKATPSPTTEEDDDEDYDPEEEEAGDDEEETRTMLTV